tara:strand:- start:423 stop:1970 length:1548 start_codon:yes stop_codon:yes gene_type:complete
MSEDREILNLRKKFSSNNEDVIIQTAIRKKYTNVKNIIKMNVGGDENQGIYRLCFGDQAEIKQQILLHKLQSLQIKLHNENDKMNIRLNELLELIRSDKSETQMTSIQNELRGLFMAGVDMNKLYPVIKKIFKSVVGPNSPIRAKRWFENSINVDTIVEKIIIKEPIDIETIMGDLGYLANITTFRERLLSDWVKLFGNVEDDSCEILLKISDDQDKLLKEKQLQIKVNNIDATITPIVMDGNPETVTNLTDDLYSFSMKFIKRGRPLCDKCPDAIDIDIKNFMEKYRGFSKENADDLLSKLKILHKNNIIQGDLHLENIMISPTSVQLIDWGNGEDISSLDEIEKNKKTDDEINKLIIFLKRLLVLIKIFTKGKGVLNKTYQPPMNYIIDRLKCQIKSDFMGSYKNEIKPDPKTRESSGVPVSKATNNSAASGSKKSSKHAPSLSKMSQLPRKKEPSTHSPPLSKMSPLPRKKEPSTHAPPLSSSTVETKKGGGKIYKKKTRKKRNRKSRRKNK